jgi:hypothetical protein
LRRIMERLLVEQQIWCRSSKGQNVISHIRNFLFLSFAMAITAHGQMYLLTASPTLKGGADAPTYPASLLNLDNQGIVTLVRSLIPRRPGAAWAGVSYEDRRAVLVTGWVSDAPDQRPSIIVVDFDKADIVKKCDWPKVPVGSPIANWLADQPGKGLVFEWKTVAAYPSEDEIVGGILLDPSIPCDKSSWTPQPEDVRYMIAHGGAGMGGIVARDNQFHIVVNPKDEMGTVNAFIGHLVPLGYQIPRVLTKNLHSMVSLLVSNQHIFAVALDGKIAFFRKSDKTWHSWPIPGESAPWIRGIGRYLASAELQLPGPQRQASAGREEWRAAGDSEELGPPTRHVAGGRIFPGRLLIYDTETEQQFAIDTNQGDSEVLLIEDGVVYYRAANRIYSAAITSKGIEPGRIRATSELIRDAHWALLKH